MSAADGVLHRSHQHSRHGRIIHNQAIAGMIKPFKKMRGGLDQLKASDWNRMGRLVVGLYNLSVAPPLRMLRTEQGTALSIAPLVAGDFFFIGKIHNLGPAAEANYTDQRYWIVEQEITNTGEADTTNLTWGDLAGGLWVTATNLAEVISTSHDFPDAASYRVMVYRMYDQSPVARYVFTSLPIVVD